MDLIDERVFIPKSVLRQCQNPSLLNVAPLIRDPLSGQMLPSAPRNGSLEWIIAVRG